MSFPQTSKKSVCFSSQICDLFVDINVAYVREIDFIFFDQIISEKRKFVDDESVTEPEGSDREDVIQSRIQVAVVDTPFRCEVVICVLSLAQHDTRPFVEDDVLPDSDDEAASVLVEELG